MSKLRFFLPAIAFILLIGFTVASFEDTFYCDDKSAAAETDACCIECTTLHHMDVNHPAPLFSVPVFGALIFPVPSFYENPFLSLADRPPIPASFFI
ncbi:MAG: hypothetical protein Q7T11_06750 [Deltaproteobacteria bacterium]|nr:hypothetical protein [Deltaproteobacteria bacterium]